MYWYDHFLDIFIRYLYALKGLDIMSVDEGVDEIKLMDLSE